MSRRPLWLCLICLPLCAQNASTPAMEAQAAALRALVGQAPKLPLERTRIKIQAPGPGWELGYPSSVTMDDKGTIYVLQRGEKADPVLVVNRDGKIIRSWGKGMYQIPHSIRIDPQGNIWTVDSSSSKVMKFTPQGEKLMEISVGEQPPARTAGSPNGATDIAFGPNGRLFISDGYGNARVLEYTAKGERVRQWGSAGTGPGQFRQPHGIAVDDQGILYVADRQNGRLQRFDLNGKYLGEWDDLGMVTTVAFRDGALWIGTQFRNEPTGADGWHMKIDRKTGKILGYVESGNSHHVLNVTNHGELLSGARPDVVWWFHQAGKPAPTFPADLVKAGESAFVQQCAFCHGRDTGGGEDGPDLTRSKLVAEDINGNQIGPVVRNGRNNMPRFTVTDQELAALAAFIHTQKSIAESQTGGRKGVDASDLTTGNIEKGKQYFNGAGKCNTCHSETGDLAGVAARNEGLKLFQRLMYPRGAKAKMTVTLPSGETVTGTRAYLDEFTAALRDASGRYRSWPIAKVKVKVDDPAEAHVELLARYTDDDIHNLVTYLLTLKQERAK